MQKLNSGLTALAVGIVLIAALDWAAAAATGRATILGQWNQADHTTTIKNTKSGPALDLRTKNGPALAVHSDNRIKNLNADEVDGMDSSDFKTNRNTIYQWTVASHAGDFTQALLPVEPGSYLVSYNVQMTGAAGTEGNPNIINCRVIQSGLSGLSTFDKSIIGDATVTSMGGPPALNGTGPALLVAGDALRLNCTMSDNQPWSTSPLQPLTVNLLRTDGTFVYAAALGRTATLKKTAN